MPFFPKLIYSISRLYIPSRPAIEYVSLHYGVHSIFGLCEMWVRCDVSVEYFDSQLYCHDPDRGHSWHGWSRALTLVDFPGCWPLSLLRSRVCVYKQRVCVVVSSLLIYLLLRKWLKSVEICCYVCFRPIYWRQNAVDLYLGCLSPLFSQWHFARFRQLYVYLQGDTSMGSMFLEFSCGFKLCIFVIAVFHKCSCSLFSFKEMSLILR